MKYKQQYAFFVLLQELEQQESASMAKIVGR